MLVDTEPAHTEPRVHRSGLVSSVGRLFSTPHLHTAPTEHIYSFLSPSHQCLWGQSLPCSGSPLIMRLGTGLNPTCPMMCGHNAQTGFLPCSSPHSKVTRSMSPRTGGHNQILAMPNPCTQVPKRPPSSLIVRSHDLRIRLCLGTCESVHDLPVSAIMYLPTLSLGMVQPAVIH